MIKILMVTGYVGEGDKEHFWSNIHPVPDTLIIDQIIVSHKPKAVAQQEIFRNITEKGSAYDFVFKLDADMTFPNIHSLTKLVELCAGQSHNVYPVFDHLTGTSIYGIHIFNGNYCEGIELANDPTFTDKLNLPEPPYYHGINSEVLIDHCRYANHEQKIQFIWHRALKIRKSKTLTQRRNAVNQIIFLLHFLRNNKDDPYINTFKKLIHLALTENITTLTPPSTSSYSLQKMPNIILLLVMIQKLLLK